MLLHSCVRVIPSIMHPIPSIYIPTCIYRLRPFASLVPLSTLPITCAPLYFIRMFNMHPLCSIIPFENVSPLLHLCNGVRLSAAVASVYDHIDGRVSWCEPHLCLCSVHRYH
jgi:hypothetical protein